MKPRPRVALFVESSRSYGRDLLRGAALFARTRTNWALIHHEMTLDAELPPWLRGPAINGVIARVSQRTIGPLRELSVPLVDVWCRFAHPGVPQVETDDDAVARLAFEHLRDRGFRRLAFCGYEHVHYSETRLRRFRALTEGAGVPLSVYLMPSTPSESVTAVEQSGLFDLEPLSHWLQSLEPPTGLFACNDVRGQQVSNACAAAEIAVPDDLGVVGVDDDDVICPLCDPPLSSVRPDAEGVGFRAAETLYELMTGPDGAAPGSSGSAPVRYVPPQTVVEQLSTQVAAVEDRELARVCRYIRDHACDGINVQDVAAFSTLSRRQLERRFRAELGRTPREEITAAQVTRVKQLLSETTMTLERISPLAGYEYQERLGAVFKRETGLTPGAYRRQAQSIPDR
ncbi:AraC family transcriptional regulator [Alienimonas californiensis]|uniref:Xylose operon regulatory protein n=1 Tax=Alienimonas californiensis TaxID=2527989 RepID=A0A517PB97_9PLAN|nr:DNA-binding transcriptional regulator [Alienimonas californiensis]QDT16647.1 Xylose operon regulatory protein [Alienimonas californiensis]